MDIVSFKIKQQVPKIIKSLRRRSLIEVVTDGFTLQHVMMKYCTKRLIDKIVEHINQNRWAIFNRHALIKATAKDEVRKAQIHFILQPVWDSLVNNMGRAGIENHLKQILSKFQQESPQKPGYLAGNTLNLLCQNSVDLTGYDFSNLTIWQAYLKGVNLSHVNFSNSDLSQSVFSELSTAAK
jgi:hypothetical protein